MTVARRLQEIGLNARVARKKPFLKPIHIRRRLQFARDHVDKPLDFWKRVIWSDESKFNLFGSDGRHLVWRKADEEFRFACTRPMVKHGGGSVMVWGCFSAHGIGNLHFIDGIMRGEDYRAILIAHLRDSARKMGLDQGFIFQQDNDPKHTSKVVRDFLSSQRIETLQWPANSPDLNPIEHIWHNIGRKLAEKRPKNKEEMKGLVLTAWNSITAHEMESLVYSMPRRLAAVIANKGGLTKY
jgi:hypothetical protein